MAENEYYNDLYVDPDNLFKEWNRNGHLAMKWAEKYGEAARELKLAEQDYKITKATIEAEVRENPADFGLPDKITESMVVMAVRTDARYKEASEKWAEAIKNSSILFEAKDNMKFQRKATCQWLTSMKLFRCDEFNQVPKEVRGVFDQQQSGEDLDAHMENYQKQNFV
jgi:hypothetical protein